MSAIVDEGENVFEPVKVLIAMHEEMDTLDAIGPLEVFSLAQHDKNDPKSKAFRVLLAGDDDDVTTAQNASIGAHINYADAMKRLPEVDVLILPGGGKELTLKGTEQPMALVKAFVALQKKNPARERTLVSICTASLALGEAGILSGLAATTHPDFFTKLEIICSNAAQRDMADRTDVMEHRFVVNNLRFELGEDEDENPYVYTRKELKEQQRRKSSLSHSVAEVPNGARRTSSARKGSMSLKQSNNRRESILKRANLRLGGLRVVTTGGITSGIDGSLYLVAALVSEEAADEVARKMCWEWKKGVVVDGIDV